MNMKQWIKLWCEERDEVIKKQNVEEFKAFYSKWKARGIYEIELPLNDMVLEITLRKMLYHLKSATKEEKAEAEKWLTERGCSTDM